MFRIDDVSINADLATLRMKVNVLVEFAPVMLSISPLVFSTQKTHQRVFPTRNTALSALHPFYLVDGAGIPDVFDWPVSTAGHGLTHVDHRLLSYDAQEMSIVASCSLARSRTFVPPYNHWNHDTETICAKHEIALLKFEEGWRHMLYNPWEDTGHLYYMHPFDMTLVQLEAWLGVK
jgi:hypothetical protein